jgi:uncharacterized protein (TIGR03437 family)
MLIAIKGQNLATSTETAGAYPLPYTLGGATVSFNAQQLDVQAPGASVSAGQTYSVLVTAAAGASSPYPIRYPLIKNVGVFHTGYDGLRASSSIQRPCGRHRQSESAAE